MRHSHQGPAGARGRILHGGLIAGTAFRSILERLKRTERCFWAEFRAWLGRTGTQRQYLTYIDYYTMIHRRPPSENEIADFFSVRGPSAHRMILPLEGRGYLSRTPGQPRTLKVQRSRESLPDPE